MPSSVDAPTLNLNAKGDLAELMVATDLRRRGFGIAIPFGEDCDFDLVLVRADRLQRVQVKYVESDSAVIVVKCFSHSLTGGRIRKTKRGRRTAAITSPPRSWEKDEARSTCG